MADPLAGSAWSKPATVAGFVTSPPNATLLRLAGEELRRSPACRALDLGCGAARNAVPLAMQGWRVLGLDLSLPMLQAARERMRAELDSRHRLQLALSPMDRLPVADRSCELVVAHGIWNLARSSAEFRAAVREAARVSADGAALFVFTFSRNTLPADAAPVHGEITSTILVNMLLLALVCSAAAYVLYFRLIADIGPTRAMTVTFLMPAFGMLWGRLFLDETITLPMLAGAVLIVAGTAGVVRPRPALRGAPP